MSLFKENRQFFDALWAQRCLEVDQANERKNELISDMLGGTSVTAKTWSCWRCGSNSADGCIANGCGLCEESEHAPGSMLGQFGGKDHIVREVVNNLRDAAIKYGSTQQLRERLRTAIQPLLEAEAKAPPTTEEQLSSIQEVVLGYMGDSHGLEQGADDTLRIAEAFLAAAKQPYTTDSDKYKADLYDEVWAKARAMGYENVTMALHDLAVAKQKAARWDRVLGAVCAEKDRRPEKDTYYFLLSRVVGRVPRNVNPMKGSVAGHFTDHIDNLIKAKPAVS